MPKTSESASTETDSILRPSQAKTKVLEYLPDGNEEFLDIYSCDVVLLVEQQEFLVHGCILASQSRVFSKMLGGVKDNLESKIDGKVSIKLSDAVEDVELMLQVLYGARVTLDTVLEAARVLFIGDKYDIPKFFRLAEPTLCRLDEQLHFRKEVSCEQEPSTKDLLDVVPLLAISDRVGLQELRTHCQFVILRDTVTAIPGRQATISPDVMYSMRSLERSGVSPRDMHEITAYLIHFLSTYPTYYRGCESYGIVQQLGPALKDNKETFLNALSMFRKGDEKL